MKNIIETKKSQTVSGVRLMLGYIGLFLIFIGLLTFLPICIIIFCPSNGYAWWFFYVPAIISVTIGGLLFIPIMNKNQGKLSSLENIFLTLFIWILAVLVSAIPYFIWGHMGGPNNPHTEVVDGIVKVSATYLEGSDQHAYYNFSECIFESVSGFSSTGLTLFPTFDSPAGSYFYNNNIFKFTTFKSFQEFLPNCQIFLFHRAVMTFIGGVGLVLILASALNYRSNMQLYLLEGHNDSLLPNLLKSARIVIFIYLGMFSLGFIGYLSIGASIFDSFCYTAAGVSTGGFASHATSIRFFSLALGENRGLAIEIVTTFIMILGMLPFIMIFFMINGKFKKVFLNYETYVFFAIIIIFFPIFFFGMRDQLGGNNSLALRHSAFEFFTFISTSGFSTLDGYSFSAGQINSTLLFVMIILTNVGGFSGSTAGGIKLYRIGDIFVSLKMNFTDMTSLPEEVKITRVYKFGNKTIVNNDDLKKSLNYIGLYLICELLIVGIIIAHGYSFTDSLFEVSSAFAGLGETTGISAFAANNHQWGVIWSLIVAMFLGRLEIQIVVFGFMRLFRRIINSKNIYRYAEK